MKSNLNTTTPCKQCKYYYGKQAIHCSVHPRGKESEYCFDWRKETGVQKVIRLVRLKRFSGEKAIALLCGIALTSIVIYYFYQTVVVAVDTYQKAERYEQKCEIFLKRAGSAGVTGVTEEELTKAVNCLAVQNLAQSFEFRNLKSNLTYLRKQPSGSTVPIVIRDSINESANSIRSSKSEELRVLGSRVGAISAALIIVVAVILALIL